MTVYSEASLTTSDDVILTLANPPHVFITCSYIDGIDVTESVKALTKSKVAEISL